MTSLVLVALASEKFYYDGYTLEPPLLLRSGRSRELSLYDPTLASRPTFLLTLDYLGATKRLPKAYLEPLLTEAVSAFAAPPLRLFRLLVLGVPFLPRLLIPRFLKFGTGTAYCLSLDWERKAEALRPLPDDNEDRARLSCVLPITESCPDRNLDRIDEGGCLLANLLLA